ncbi:hypothetical protein AT2G04675 [Arabidopsis thaliana]|uniref:Expressed protein n=2 Tax=Arabidopsis thaliana TaxID=3702 RepID=Q8S8E6_ARATH|nr:uncharacterized protein AT2G04675 [Arabidopsis thaliana]AAM15342.1 Expressed protein [Arabidopsis thaliana]ABE65801.1 unknown [Arabidopsis thaliana]AEC05854.1 hypothetical protein AT2G04675 [Arabidopsis thaliana]|eukprot:NP_565312.1 hypothetical protein AT2G04675 [Arabidopsis thaliana]
MDKSIRGECFKYRAPYTRGSCDNYKHVKSAVCKKVCQRRKDFDGRCELFQDERGLQLGCLCFSSDCK